MADDDTRFERITESARRRAETNSMVRRRWCGDVTESLLNLHVARMRQHVPRQDAGLRERLATRLADMRPLPCMRQHVFRQAVGARERLAARLADMRPIARMRAQVHSQLAV